MRVTLTILWLYLATMVAYGQPNPYAASGDTIWLNGGEVGIVHLDGNRFVTNYRTTIRIVEKQPDRDRYFILLCRGGIAEVSPMNNRIVKILAKDQALILTVRENRDEDVRTLAVDTFNVLVPPVPDIWLVNQGLDSILVRADSVYHLSVSTIFSYVFKVYNDNIFYSIYSSIQPDWVIDSLLICKIGDDSKFEGSFSVDKSRAFAFNSWQVGATYAINIRAHNNRDLQSQNYLPFRSNVSSHHQHLEHIPSESELTSCCVTFDADECSVFYIKVTR